MKQILLFMLVFFSGIIMAQEPVLEIEDNLDFKELESKFSTLKSGHITTGLLREKAILYFVDFDKFNGEANCDTANYDIFTQAYLELKNSAVRSDAIDTAIYSKIPQNKDFYPVIILNYNYNEIKSNAFDKGLIKEKNGKYYETRHSGSPYLEKKIVLATIPAQNISGETITFKVSDDFYFSNEQIPVDYYEIDFDDGRGFNIYYSDDLITVSYETSGNKIIRIKIHLKNGNVLYANFSVKDDDFDPPTPDIEEYEITASRPYWNWYNTENPNDINGAYGKALVTVWYAPGHDTLIKPFILLDGFDPFKDALYEKQNRNYDSLYKDLMQIETLQKLQECYEYDIVVVDWVGGADWIQKNALALVDVLEWINSIKVGYYKNVILGPSMGGQIARWGLSYMEQQGIDHQVSVYISWDSPQRGANIPLGLQFWVNKIKDKEASAMIMYNALMSPAARQLLLYHFNACTQTKNSKGQYIVDQEVMRDAYVAELESFGYPNEPLKIAVANGSNYGHNQNNAEGEEIHPKTMLLFQHTAVLLPPAYVATKIYALPDITDDMSKILTFRVYPWEFKNLIVKVQNTQPYDCAPGGIYPGLTKLENMDGMDLYHPYVDFIPTISSLDLDHSINDLYYHPITVSQTPFDYIFYPPQTPADCFEPGYAPTYPYSYNEMHSSLDCPMQDALLAIVEGNLENDLLIQNATLFEPDVSGTVDIRAKNTIRAGYAVNPDETYGNVTVTEENHVQFIAGNSIILEPGFEAGPGFEAFILSGFDCDLYKDKQNYFNQPPAEDITYSTTEETQNISPKKVEKLTMSIFPNPAKENIRIYCTFPAAGNFSLQLYDIYGNEVREIKNGFNTAGISEFNITLTNLPSGVYFCILKTQQGFISKKIVKM